MRSAEEGEIWRKLSKRNHASAPTVSDITLSKLAGFRDASFSMENGFLCVCGGTGQGKTALLQVLERALGPGNDNSSNHVADRVKVAEVSMRVKFSEEEYSLSGTSGAYPLGVRLVDLWDRSFGPVKYFRDHDLTVLKEGITPVEIKGNVLADISAAASKRYDKVIVFEIEGENEDVLPFFEVSENGIAYD